MTKSFLLPLLLLSLAPAHAVNPPKLCPDFAPDLIDKAKWVWMDRNCKFRTRADFTPREKAALELAERETLDSRSIDDEFWAELRRHFEEGEIIELAAAIGLFNYFNRFNNSLKMEPTK